MSLHPQQSIPAADQAVVFHLVRGDRHQGVHGKDVRVDLVVGNRGTGACDEGGAMVRKNHVLGPGHGRQGDDGGQVLGRQR